MITSRGCVPPSPRSLYGRVYLISTGRSGRLFFYPIKAPAYVSLTPFFCCLPYLGDAGSRPSFCSTEEQHNSWTSPISLRPPLAADLCHPPSTALCAVAPCVTFFFSRIARLDAAFHSCFFFQFFLFPLLRPVKVEFRFSLCWRVSHGPQSLENPLQGTMASTPGVRLGPPFVLRFFVTP